MRNSQHTGRPCHEAYGTNGFIDRDSAEEPGDPQGDVPERRHQVGNRQQARRLEGRIGVGSCDHDGCAALPRLNMLSRANSAYPVTARPDCGPPGKRPRSDSRAPFPASRAAAARRRATLRAVSRDGPLVRQLIVGEPYLIVAAERERRCPVLHSATDVCRWRRPGSGDMPSAWSLAGARATA